MGRKDDGRAGKHAGRGTPHDPRRGQGRKKGSGGGGGGAAMDELDRQSRDPRKGQGREERAPKQSFNREDSVLHGGAGAGATGQVGFTEREAAKDEAERQARQGPFRKEGDGEGDDAYERFVHEQRAAIDKWKEEYVNLASTLTKVNMSTESQQLVEDLLVDLRHGDDKPTVDVLFGSEAIALGKQLRNSEEARFLLRALVELRFRQDHARQACAFVLATNDGKLARKQDLLQSALDWLCLNVEDADLPRQFASLMGLRTLVNADAQKRKAAKRATMSEEKKLVEELGAEESRQALRLLELGFTHKKAIDTLRLQTEPSRGNSGPDAKVRLVADEDEALATLLLEELRTVERDMLRPTEGLRIDHADGMAYEHADFMAQYGDDEGQLRWGRAEQFLEDEGAPSAKEFEELAELRSEEKMALEAIMGAENFAQAPPGEGGCTRVELTLQVVAVAAGEGVEGASSQVKLLVVEPEGCAYPRRPPLVALHCEDLLPRTRLEVTRRLLREGTQMVRVNGGEAPVLYELSQWLEAQLPHILRMVTKAGEKAAKAEAVRVEREAAQKKKKKAQKKKANSVEGSMARTKQGDTKQTRTRQTKQDEQNAKDQAIYEKRDAQNRALLAGQKLADEKKCQKEALDKADVEAKAAKAAKYLRLKTEREAQELVDAKRKEKEALSAAEALRVAHEAKLAAKRHASGRVMHPTKAKSDQLLRDFRMWQQRPGYKKMAAVRERLPARKKCDELLAAVRSAQVVVVSGETGCGKTTQVPQFIMDEMLSNGNGSACSIVCTQPRRISAMGVAERVAAERDEPCGNTIGYQIRLERKASAATRLLFCTTGILLRRLQGDPLCRDVSHFVIDEIHERSLESDFLLIILRDLCVKRPDLKVVLMSATLNADLFSSYFGKCPVVHIEGFTFPVTEYYFEDVLELTGHVIEEDSDYALGPDGISKQRGRGGGRSKPRCGGGGKGAGGAAGLIKEGSAEDERQKGIRKIYGDEYSDETLTSLQRFDEDVINYEVIESLIIAIDECMDDGAILVFVPGLMEISTLHSALTTNHQAFPQSKWRVYPLHSTLSNQEQSRVFEVMPRGVRKVVIATNIAETSITIEDISFVIDSGRHKENHYDPINKMPQLLETWVARANSRQRRGRAGRVKQGSCFFMYTRVRRDKMLPFQIPEILRVPLDELCLQIKLQQLGDVKEFLSKAIEPPSKDAVEQAVITLQELRALDMKEFLTPLGYHLAALPVNVRIGKMLLYATIFQCLDPVLTIAAGLGYRSPFVAPFEKRDEADKLRRKFAVHKSDHLTLLKAYNGWLAAREQGKERQYCQTNFLSVQTLRMITQMKRQFLDLLVEIGFVNAAAARGGGGGGGRGKRQQQVGSAMGGDEYNRHSAQLHLIRAVLCAGLYPNVVRVEVQPPKPGRDGKPGYARPPLLFQRSEVAQGEGARGEDGRMSMHPASVNFETKEWESNYIMFFEKVKTTKVYLRDSTMVSPYPLLLFGGEIKVLHERKIVSVDQWIEFNMPAKVGVLISCLRAELDKLLLQKIERPELEIYAADRTIDAITALLAAEAGQGVAGPAKKR